MFINQSFSMRHGKPIKNSCRNTTRLLHTRLSRLPDVGFFTAQFGKLYRWMGNFGNVEFIEEGQHFC